MIDSIWGQRWLCLMDGHLELGFRDLVGSLRCHRTSMTLFRREEAGLVRMSVCLGSKLRFAKGIWESGIFGRI